MFKISLYGVPPHHHQANTSISPKLKFSFSTDSYSEKPLIFRFGGISFLKLMGMYGDLY